MTLMTSLPRVSSRNAGSGAEKETGARWGTGARMRHNGEPVAWWGPIVMNSRQELETAIEEYREGTFIKHGRPVRVR